MRGSRSHTWPDSGTTGPPTPISIDYFIGEENLVGLGIGEGCLPPDNPIDDGTHYISRLNLA